MKLIIAGSRDLSEEWIYKQLKIQVFLLQDRYGKLTRILSGGARGVDRLAERFAQENHIQFVEYPAMWESFPGKSAGFLRNVALAEDGDRLLAIWDGKSRGTKHMIDTMTNKQKPVTVFQVHKDSGGL